MRVFVIDITLVAAARQFLRISCMAHLLNLTADDAILELVNRVKSIVAYLKQFVSAMDN